MGHMLARLVYLMLRYGEQYVDKGVKYYDISRARNPQHSEKSQGPRPGGYSLHRRIREVSEEPPVCRQPVRNRPDAVHAANVYASSLPRDCPLCAADNGDQFLGPTDP